MSPRKTPIIPLINLTINRPATVIAGCLIICSIFLSGVPSFGINPSTREYLGYGSPLIQHLVHLEEEYVEDINIFLMIEPDKGDVFSNDTLGAIETLTEAAWALPYVRRVDSLSNFQYTQADGDDLLVQNLVENAPQLSTADLEKIQSYAMNEPELTGLFLAKDGRAAGINILLNVDLGDPVALNSITDQLEVIKQQVLDTYADISIYESGYASLSDQLNRAAETDIKTVLSLALLLIFFGLLYFLGNLRAALAVLVTSLLAVLVGIGLLGLLSIELNPASIMATLMVLVLGLADGIHITKSARRLIAAGAPNRTAIRDSVTSNFTPILLTSLTTAMGFSTFSMSGYAGIEIMGYYVAFGVMTAFVLSILLLPAALCYCDLPPEKARKTKTATYIYEFVLKFHKPLLAITVPSILIAIYCISLIEYDERTTHYLRSDQPFRIHLDKIEQDLTGPITIIYNFNSGESGGVASPDFLKKVDAFATWAKQLPEVRHVSAFTDTIKRLNQNLNAGNTDYYRIPDSQELAAQYMLLYELSLPYGLDLTNQVNLDKSGTRVVLNINDMSTQEAMSFVARNEAWLTENIPKFDSFGNSNSISGLLMSEESGRIIAMSGITALIIIGIILLFTFRSFYAGLWCVVSVISPILISYGLWGILIGRIGLPGVLSICMVIGIAVDFSVHLVSKFVYARRHLHQDTKQSIEYAIRYTSSPILTSAAIMGSGFAILTISVVEFNVVMGALTATCIFFSAFSALLLVPSILMIERFSIK